DFADISVHHAVVSPSSVDTIWPPHGEWVEGLVRQQVDLLSQSVDTFIVPSLHIEPDVQYDLSNNIDSQARGLFFEAEHFILLRMFCEFVDVNQSVVNDSWCESDKVLCAEAWTKLGMEHDGR
ncbi:UNVERIFIED_CONTAM: hypothetical protein NY603_17715, partial [Bacteroidetes bacterium 56_B9]